MTLEISPFHATTCPDAAELGRALQDNVPAVGAKLQLHFGDAVARLAIADVWSACCELLLQAQLVRERKLAHFILDAEEIFDLSYTQGAVICSFSPLHRFAVDREALASSFEELVADIFAATSFPPLTRIVAASGASAIRAQPYANKFSDLVLM